MRHQLSDTIHERTGRARENCPLKNHILRSNLPILKLFSISHCCSHIINIIKQNRSTSTDNNTVTNCPVTGDAMAMCVIVRLCSCLESTDVQLYNCISCGDYIIRFKDVSNNAIIFKKCLCSRKNLMQSQLSTVVYVDCFLTWKCNLKVGCGVELLDALTKVVAVPYLVALNINLQNGSSMLIRGVKQLGIN